MIPNLAQACDQPLAGLITDLKQRGLLDSTLIVWGGEMGRGGAGHMNHNGSAFTWWMAGGGVKPGFAYGATDDQGFTAVDKPIHVRDLHATILWMCGLDFEQLKHNGIGFDTTCKVAHGIMA
jgi:arylsulfatase A-like enzyme